MMSLLSSILEIAYGKKGDRYMLCVSWIEFLLIFIHTKLVILFDFVLTESILQNTPAHICYLVAEANFEAYSDSARLCLIGADHLKYPRTYASPEAIQVIHIIFIYLFFLLLYVFVLNFELN